MFSRSVVLIFLIGLTFQSAMSQPLAKGQSKFFGAGTSGSIWSGADLYWNQMTPGNDGKWGSVEGTQGQYNWTNLDNIYNYAVNRGIRFKDHCLVWGSQQPAWIASLDSANQRAAVTNWIRLVGERYPSMSFVDVVNEPFHAPPPYKNALGGDGATGWDWVITAFQLARQYCVPGVKLILNEYNILQSNSVTTNYINLVTLLKDRGLIDGIGVQGHYFEFRSDSNATSNIYVYDINVIKANLDRLGALGLPIYISEFDIDEPDDAIQLKEYQIYFPIFWTHPAVKGITLWGYIQNDVWNSHPNTYLLLSNGAERSALKWLRIYVASPALVSPLGLTNQPRNALLVWRRSTPATSYRVQVSADTTFSSLTVNTVVFDTTLQVSTLAANTQFYWRVTASNINGTSAYSTTGDFTTGIVIVNDVAELPGIPTDFTLAQNHPNPFNPATHVEYSIPARTFVSLKVYSVIGREMGTLFSGVQEQGRHRVSFDGGTFASGVYFCRMETSSGFSQTIRMALIK